MKNIIANNYELILIAAAVVLTFLARIINGELNTSKNKLFELITNAEKNYGAGTGVIKKAAVVAEFSQSLSLLLKAFLGPNRISKMVENALTYAKEIWAQSENIRSYINENTKVE